MSRNYPKFTVTDKAANSIRRGHVWVYAEEIVDVSGNPENGGIVDVFSRKGSWLGAGFLSEHSKIRVRLLSRNTNDTFDRAFWERRIRYAIDYRRAVMGADFSACRLIFGEADGFPGLTADLFNDVVVTEVLSYGTDKIKNMLYSLLVEELARGGVNVRAVYERSDSPIREKEGLPAFCGYAEVDGLTKIPPEDDERLVITENGIRYEINYITGQKTGFFLDQKYNRVAVARIAKGRHVLDCFTHTGAFALNAAAAGAAAVTAVDISDDAIALARKNAELNGLSDKIDFVRADVFEYLTELSKSRGAYDLIILDPPAFTKSNSTVKNALRGYREINRLAMKILPRGGFLATCSCSHFMTDALFREAIAGAASDAAVSLREVEGRRQSPDHPILWGVPETEYLKFYIFQVV